MIGVEGTVPVRLRCVDVSIAPVGIGRVASDDVIVAVGLGAVGAAGTVTFDGAEARPTG